MFNLKECDVCNKKMPGIGFYELQDGIICPGCLKKTGLSKAAFNRDAIYSNTTVKEARTAYDTGVKIDMKPKKEFVKSNKKEIKNQNKQKQIDFENKLKDHGAENHDIFITDYIDKIAYTQGGLFQQSQAINFNDIVGYREIVEGKSKKKHHGLTRAATGGLLFGGFGAVVGAVTGGKQLDIVTRIGIQVNLSNGSNLTFTFLDKECNADSNEAKKSNQRLANATGVLDSILKSNDNDQVGKSLSQDKDSSSVADEIRKFKQLLDDGIITEEEFDKKKKELL